MPHEWPVVGDALSFFALAGEFGLCFSVNATIDARSFVFRLPYGLTVAGDAWPFFAPAGEFELRFRVDALLDATSVCSQTLPELTVAGAVLSFFALVERFSPSLQSPYPFCCYQSRTSYQLQIDCFRSSFLYFHMWIFHFLPSQAISPSGFSVNAAVEPTVLWLEYALLEGVSEAVSSIDIHEPSFLLLF